MRFSDPIDQGSELAMRYTDFAIKAHATKVAPQQVQNPDGTWPVTHCVDCDCEIEKPRLEAARIRCVSCQTDLENKEKRNGCR